MKRAYLLFLGGIAAIELISLLTFRHTTLAGWFMVVGLLALLLASWRRPWLVPLVMIAELAVGGKGYLLSVHWHGVWPLRLGLFTILVLVLILHAKFVRTKVRTIKGWKWPVALIIWVAVVTGWSLLQHISPSRIFLDMNAFLFLFVLGGWWIFLRQQPNWKDYVWSAVMAGVTWVGLESFFLVVAFGSQTSITTDLYSWIWRTKTGEITAIGSHLFRVFLQSDIYALLMGLTILVWPSSTWRGWMLVPALGASTALWASLSRSYWLGLAAGVLMVVWMLVRQQNSARLVTRRLLLIALGGFLLFNWSANFPNPIPFVGQRNALSARLENEGAAQASSARWNQISPLLSAIREQPILGRGFGTTVTYENPDPRNHGLVTTSAFELGYLDWWLDLGVVGLFILGFWLWSLFRRAYRQPTTRFLTPALVALVAVHATSPYLNHPLGLGWLALTTLFLYDQQ